MSATRGRNATISKGKKPKLCKFKVSATTPQGTTLRMEAPDILPSCIHALIRCTTATACSPDPVRQPNGKPDYVFLDKFQLDLLKEQIMLVLADYQSTDYSGFARNEGIRLEVAKRILENMTIIAAGNGEADELDEEKESADDDLRRHLP